MVAFRVLYHRTMRDVHFVEPGTVSRALYDDIGLVEAEHLGALFRDMNAVDGSETCCKMRVRSMSVGDIAIDTRNDAAYYCASVGWERVELAP